MCEPADSMGWETGQRELRNDMGNGCVELPVVYFCFGNQPVGMGKCVSGGGLLPGGRHYSCN